MTDADTYAATLALGVFRALMATAAASDADLRQYDALNAFANADLPKKIYCRCPEGFGQDASCVLVSKALYGLKNHPDCGSMISPRQDKTFVNLGLLPVPGINCLYRNDWLLVFYVDDMYQPILDQTDNLRRRHTVKPAA